MKAVDMDTFVNQLAMERNKALGQSEDFNLAEGEEDMSSELLDKDILGQLSEAPIDKNTNIQKLVENIVNAANPEVKAQNMQKITEQAQVLIQKGGGEMKVQLSPEGMGDVLLKVKVQDGQVGIQMTTDNHHAKKLIESSISDLKVTLADHKLNLETIKVDVADKMQDQFNQNSDFRREDAREFLSQFRQNNDGFRQSMFSSPGNRSYQKTTQSNTPDIKPLDNTNRNNNGRIHLVA
jgi:flagellar hook-length control protein FliK